jgi:hypothetical protein
VTGIERDVKELGSLTIARLPDGPAWHNSAGDGFALANASRDEVITANVSKNEIGELASESACSHQKLSEGLPVASLPSAGGVQSSVP